MARPSPHLASHPSRAGQEAAGGQAPLRVALYTRVSTDQQASKEEGSLETQEARLRASLAARAERAEVRHVFREEGVSGKSLDRPALRRLMDHIKAGDIDCVMVTRLDRLSRSLLDFYELHHLFEAHGVQFISLGESFDTSTALGRAMLKLVLVFAELEREQTAERTRVAFQARAERGLWNGGRAPLGYDLSPAGNLQVNPAEADIVRLIFEKYLELRSTSKLAAWLDARGHRPKYGAVGRGHGDTFTSAGVRHVLKSRVYLGEITHKGEAFAGQHDAFIPLETWERVQAIIATHARAKGSPGAHSHYDYLLTGLLRCACGNALTPSSANGHGGRYHYYRCVGMVKRTQVDCPVKQVRAERLDEAVLEIVREATRRPELLAEAVAEANRMARERVQPLQQEVDSLRKALAASESDAHRVLRSILDAGIGASPTAKRILAETEARQAQLTRSLAEAEGQLATRHTEHLDLQFVIEALRSFDAAFEHLDLGEKRELLQLMIKEVRVQPEHVEVELYEGGTAMRLLEQVAGTRGKKGGGRNGAGGPTRRGGTTTDADGGGDTRDAQAAEAGGAPRGGPNEQTPAGGLGFVATEFWLPGRAHRQNVGHWSQSLAK